MTTTMQRRLGNGQQQRAEQPPTDRLLRVMPFAVRSGEAEEADDGLTLDGYAAVFNRETLIDSWEGRFWEKASPGSMKKTFREQVPKVQFDHGTHPMIGSMPIAAVRSIAEESDPVLAPDGGAHLVARLFDNWLIEPVRDAIREEAINGMSFRFSVVKEQWFDADGKRVTDPQELRDLLFRSWYEDVPDDELLHRDLKELRVPELGPVVWPAYGDTSVGVRSERVVIDLRAIRSGDAEERRKLADTLFAVDALTAREAADGSSPNPGPDVQGTVAAEQEEVPEGTAADAVAADHTADAPPADAPDSTADTAAAAHSQHDPQAARAALLEALSDIRQRTRRFPEAPA